MAGRIPRGVWCLLLLGHRYKVLANDTGDKYRWCARCGKQTEMPYQGGANVGGG
jgi:hypothetical protein